MKILIKPIHFLSLFLVLFPLSLFATTGEIGSLQQLLTQASIFLAYSVDIVISLALVFFLWGMAIFILNAGNEEKRKGGKQKMLWGIIALTIIIAIWGIIKFLQLAIFGSSTFNPPI